MKFFKWILGRPELEQRRGLEAKAEAAIAMQPAEASLPQFDVRDFVFEAEEPVPDSVPVDIESLQHQVTESIREAMVESVGQMSQQMNERAEDLARAINDYAVTNPNQAISTVGYAVPADTGTAYTAADGAILTTSTAGSYAYHPQYQQIKIAKPVPEDMGVAEGGALVIPDALHKRASKESGFFDSVAECPKCDYVIMIGPNDIECECPKCNVAFDIQRRGFGIKNSVDPQIMSNGTFTPQEVAATWNANVAAGGSGISGSASYAAGTGSTTLTAASAPRHHGVLRSDLLGGNPSVHQAMREAEMHAEMRDRERQRQMVDSVRRRQQEMERNQNLYSRQEYWDRQAAEATDRNRRGSQQRHYSEALGIHLNYDPNTP